MATSIEIVNHDNLQNAYVYIIFFSINYLFPAVYPSFWCIRSVQTCYILFTKTLSYHLFAIQGACPFYGTPLFSANFRKFLQSLVSEFQTFNHHNLQLFVRDMSWMWFCVSHFCSTSLSEAMLTHMLLNLH